MWPVSLSLTFIILDRPTDVRVDASLIYVSAAVDELGCRYTVCGQGRPQETKTWRTRLPQRRCPYYCRHEHGTVMCKRSYREHLFWVSIFNCLTPDSDCSFLEEGILHGQTQHHRRGRPHKLHQRAWKGGSACGPQPQPHAVRVLFPWIEHFCLAVCTSLLLQ